MCKNRWRFDFKFFTLSWRHHEGHGVSNHRRHQCLFNRMFRRESKKRSKLRVTLYEGDPPMTSGFPSQRAGNAETISILWQHHGEPITLGILCGMVVPVLVSWQQILCTWMTFAENANNCVKFILISRNRISRMNGSNFINKQHIPNAWWYAKISWLPTVFLDICWLSDKHIHRWV